MREYRNSGPMNVDRNMLADNIRGMTWKNPDRAVDFMEHGLPFRILNGGALGSVEAQRLDSRCERQGC